VSVAGREVCVEGRHEEKSEDGTRMVARQFVRRCVFLSLIHFIFNINTFFSIKHFFTHFDTYDSCYISIFVRNV
jgi:hypothetical protein